MKYREDLKKLSDRCDSEKSERFMIYKLSACQLKFLN